MKQPDGRAEGLSGRSRRRQPTDYVDLDKEVVLDRQGRRITEADAVRLAEETLEQLGRGRRSLTGRAEHSPRVSVRVTDEIARKLDELAEREGKTRSEIARAAIERYVS